MGNRRRIWVGGIGGRYSWVLGCVRVVVMVMVGLGWEGGRSGVKLVLIEVWSVRGELCVRSPGSFGVGSQRGGKREEGEERGRNGEKRAEEKRKGRRKEGERRKGRKKKRGKEGNEEGEKKGRKGEKGGM
ncbi:hypothetical protein Tco_0829116 [Tanacetum coccineum]